MTSLLLSAQETGLYVDVDTVSLSPEPGARTRLLRRRDGARLRRNTRGDRATLGEQHPRCASFRAGTPVVCDRRPWTI